MAQRNRNTQEANNASRENSAAVAQNISEGVFGLGKSAPSASFRSRICNRSEWWLNVDYAEHILVDNARSVSSLPESA